jgi:hypothetical protein
MADQDTPPRPESVSTQAMRAQLIGIVERLPDEAVRRLYAFLVRWTSDWRGS